jgi:phage-related protein
MPLAGYAGVDVSENFIKCTTKSFGDYAGMAMDPLHGQMSLVADSLGEISGALSDMRGLFSSVRGGFGMVFQMVFGKISNLMSSMQYLMIRIRTVMARIVGVFASIIYAFYAGEQTGESVWNGPIGGAIRMF